MFYLTLYFVLKGAYHIVILYRNIFSRCALIWDSISKTLNLFWNILGSTSRIRALRKNNTMNFLFICLFAKLRQTLQSSRNTSYWRRSYFCAKCYYQFLALIFLYTMEKIPWKSYVRFSKWNIIRTPQRPKIDFRENLI